MPSVEAAHGTAPNVDLRDADERTPFDDDGEYRIIECYCCTCEESATILAEAGRTRCWEHDERNASHVIDYWRED